MSKKPRTIQNTADRLPPLDVPEKVYRFRREDDPDIFAKIPEHVLEIELHVVVFYGKYDSHWVKAWGAVPGDGAWFTYTDIQKLLESTK